MPGHYEVGLSLRTFDSPLFGTDSTATYHLFGNQAFADGASYSVWWNGGFPGYSDQYGIEGKGIRVADRTAGFVVGDFLHGALVPEDVSDHSSDVFPLVGGRVLLRDGQTAWSLFSGSAKYELALPGRPSARPALYGSEYLGSRGGNHFSMGLTVVDTPIHAEGAAENVRDAVLSGRYLREITPWVHVFGEVLSAGGRDLGYRAGAHWRFQNGNLHSSLYSFADGFPYVYPLYRPGERGLEVRGRYEPTELSTVHGHVTYASDPLTLRRTELRGSLGVGLRFGSNRPSLSFDWSHDDVVYESLVAPRESLLANRIACSVGKGGSSGYAHFTLSHDSISRVPGLDRTQGLLVFRTVLGPTTWLDGSAVAQRDEAGNLGVTADAAVERPLRPHLNYLVGLGGAYVERGGAPSGEGVLRLGLSRRLAGNGWNARLELRLPFAVGIESSELNRRYVSFDLGNRFRWKDLRSLEPMSFLRSDRESVGSIEGRVLRGGSGEAGVSVLVDGAPSGVTRSDGSFRVRNARAGRRWISLDLRHLDPRDGVVGGPTREVRVSPGQTASLEFQITPFSTFQGALLACRDGGESPLGGIEVTLRGEEFSESVRTSVVGSFQFGNVPPGVYDIGIGPAPKGSRISTGEAGPLRVNLNEDRMGCVLRLGCVDSREGRAALTLVCGPASPEGKASE